MVEISASVGSGGINKDKDVRTVRKLLKAHVQALGMDSFDDDDDEVDDELLKAIRAYQKKVVGIAEPDGRIDPGGRTWKALVAGKTVAAASDSTVLSGKAWWIANQANYPNSAALAQLEQPFRDKVKKFIAALKDAGARVSVSATRRNESRARLMNACWRVSKGTLKPKDVPAIPDCRIEWDHGDDAASRRGAREMVDMFKIAFQPSLTSLHIKGRAIDMTIRWDGTIKVKDANGNLKSVGAPRDDSNPVLHAIGASYGVIKLVSDPPHWSDNGH